MELEGEVKLKPDALRVKFLHKVDALLSELLQKRMRLPPHLTWYILNITGGIE